MPCRCSDQASSKARPRSGNGSHEAATPARDYSIAAVGRALDLLEALSRIGPAPLAALADRARCTRTAGFRLLRTLVTEQGQTIIMVTHDPIAAAWADRVVFLADGRIAGRLDRPTPGSVLDWLKSLGGEGL